MGVGKRIGDIAKEQKIPLRKIALNAGISYNTLYAIVKRDSNRVELETLIKIADCLNVPVDYLYFGKIDPSEPEDKKLLDEVNRQGLVDGKIIEGIDLTQSEQEIIRMLRNMNKDQIIKAILDLQKIISEQEDNTRSDKK